MFKIGQRFTNHLMQECIIITIRRKVVRLRIFSNIPYIQPWDLEEFEEVVGIKKLFVPLPPERIVRSNLGEHLYKYQLKMAGLSERDNPKKVTQRDIDDFKGYGILVIRKVLKCNRQKAEDTLLWFNKTFEFGARW